MSVINTQMFSVFPEKLYRALSGLNENQLESLNIYNIINLDNLKKFMMDVMNNPSKKFIFHYNFSPYAVVNQQFVTAYLANANGQYEPFKNALRLELDKIIKALDTIIPGYKAMSFEKKIDFITSKLEIVFEKFSQMLHRQGIRNVEFKKLSDINRNFALKVSKTFVVDSAIDLAKTFLMAYYTKYYPKLKIIQSDLDRMTNDKTIYETMDILNKTNIAFTVASKEEGWNNAGMDEYILSHHLIIAQGEEASKVFDAAIRLSQKLIDSASQCFQMIYDNQKLDPNGSNITSLMFSILYDADVEKAFQELMKSQGKLNKQQWKKSCEACGIKPTKKLPAGGTWCPGNNPRDKELLIKYDLEDFIRGYKEVESYLKSNKIYISPSQCSIQFLEAIEACKSHKKSNK